MDASRASRRRSRVLARRAPGVGEGRRLDVAEILERAQLRVLGAVEHERVAPERDVDDRDDLAGEGRVLAARVLEQELVEGREHELGLTSAERRERGLRSVVGLADEAVEDVRVGRELVHARVSETPA